MKKTTGFTESILTFDPKNAKSIDIVKGVNINKISNTKFDTINKLFIQEMKQKS
jgi:hypothetical protein